MTYVGAYLDRENNRVRVAERVKGVRKFIDHPTRYLFYYPDSRGTFTSIFGDKLSKYETTEYKTFQKELAYMRDRQLFESDTNVLHRVLEDHYSNADTPTLHIALFDIEVDFNPAIGYATTEDPYAPINAISVYQSWTDKMLTFTVKPNTLTTDQALEICNKFENTILCDNEKELLRKFYEAIEDSDVVSGWNSTFFDIPYIIGRTNLTLGKTATKNFCFWDKPPNKRLIEQFGREQLSYDLVGREHLDYLDLYRKHSAQEVHSYRLDYIGELEVGERKTVYEGSLDKLYNNDFERFIEYNRQDVGILVKIDKKNKYIELALTIAHTNSVLMKTTLGTVALVEQAIINDAHKRGLIVPDKKHAETHGSAAGAFVSDPKPGIHEYVGCIDINSLYPSTIRALNICPETIIGQVRSTETEEYLKSKVNQGMSETDAWHNVFGTLEYQKIIAKSDDEVTIDYEDGHSDTFKASEVYELIFKSDIGWILSANGTIFRSDVDGIIPAVLTKWYNERKEMQGKKKDFGKLASKETDAVKKKEYQQQEQFWNQRQQARKILLNSLYGALLNPGFRFYDIRMGQSVTLTGRCITKHMSAVTNQLITGKFDYAGDAVIANDTDSVYFSATNTIRTTDDFKDFEETKENYVSLYDAIADSVNESFPEFMVKNFNVSLERGAIIQAGRELVGSRGLFIKKKRYAIMNYEKEGKRLDTDNKPGEIKAMGLDTKRTDTPRKVQLFLQDMLQKVLIGNSEVEVLDFIKTFREEFRNWKSWEKGTPKSVNGLTGYMAKLKAQGNKTIMPGHVRAAMNWNTLRKMNSDKFSIEIKDGMKTVVCKLKDNPMKMTSIAYPVDETHIPQWFMDLPFDDAEMETVILDQKIENIIGVLNWNLKSTKEMNNFNALFKPKSKK